MYELNQIFENTYPPEAALWCNSSDGKYFINEIEPVGNTRRFQIQEVPVEEPDPNIEINRQIQELKQNLADTDYIIIKVAEGLAHREDYEHIYAKRDAWRAGIKELEAQLV